MNTDTPLPPEEPAGKNPPDGAIINYYLKSKVSGPVVIEILDGSGRLVRRYSSDDKPEAIDEIGRRVNIPTYWIRLPQPVSTEAGMQRFVWDLHYGPCDWLPAQFPISAIYRDTWREPQGPWALPGNYTVRLTVAGRTFSQPLVLKMDPRVKTPAEGLGQQHDIAMKCYESLIQVRDALAELRSLRAQLKELAGRVTAGPLADAIATLDKSCGALEGTGGGRFGGAGGGEPTLNRVQGELLTLMDIVEGADVAPTTQANSASDALQKRLASVLSRWREMKYRDVKPLNDQLRQAGLPAVRN